jgi:hypothetical protein
MSARACQEQYSNIKQYHKPCQDGMLTSDLHFLSKFAQVAKLQLLRSPCLFSCCCACSYAHKVAAGYRPSRSKSKLMTDTMWSLISACWQQDPLLRPHMSEVRRHGNKSELQCTSTFTRHRMLLVKQSLEVPCLHNVLASGAGRAHAAGCHNTGTFGAVAYAVT